MMCVQKKKNPEKKGVNSVGEKSVEACRSGWGGASIKWGTEGHKQGVIIEGKKGATLKSEVAQILGGPPKKQIKGKRQSRSAGFRSSDSLSGEKITSKKGGVYTEGLSWIELVGALRVVTKDGTSPSGNG